VIIVVPRTLGTKKKTIPNIIAVVLSPSVEGMLNMIAMIFAAKVTTIVIQLKLLFLDILNIAKTIHTPTTSDDQMLRL